MADDPEWQQLPPHPPAWRPPTPTPWGNVDERSGWGGPPLAGLLAPRWAQRVRLLSGTTLLGALLVIGWTAVARRPVPGLGLAIVVVVPSIALGQLLAITVLNRDRTPRRVRGSKRPASGAPRAPRSLRLLGLQPWQSAILIAFAVLGWGSAMISFATSGTDADPIRCQATIDEHGEPLCVTAASKERSDAAIQRFSAGVILSFASLHTAAAQATLNRARREGSAGSATPSSGPARGGRR